MPKLDWRDVQFSAISFAAAMAALYWSMSIDLRQPYWSMLSVYVVSQPVAAAVRSKAVYRLMGTVLGAAVAVVLLPNLANAPLLLSLALSLWVGGCLTISLLDRSPRSYVMMLAGYTAAIVGFTSVNQPAEIFDLAVARAEEISIGIVCATVAHSLWFPRPMGDALRARIRQWLSEADHWALDVLGGDAAAAGQDRARLAGAASEIHLMAAHLPFDTSHLRETTATVRALHDRILMLIPILSSLSDRLEALRAEAPELDADTRETLGTVARWIRNECPAAERAAITQALEARCARSDRSVWYGLNLIGLHARLHDLVRVQAESRGLLDHLHAPDAPLAPPLRGIVAAAVARPLHSDLGLALVSGAVAATAIMISCAAWIGLGWAEGGASAVIAAILCCLFAAMDDPAPAIKKFGIAICIAVALAGIYLFVIFPRIDSFPMLALVLAPTLLAIGIATVNPKLATSALLILLNFCNYTGLQERFAPDLAAFLNNNLSQFFGVFVAIYVTRTARSMTTEASARRLLRATWRELARLAQGRTSESREDVAARMVDRIGLLAPRLAAIQEGEFAGGDALRELRVSMDLSVLQDSHSQLPKPAEAAIAQLLQAVGRHYAARPSGTTADDRDMLDLLDHSIRLVAEHPSPSSSPALAALVGLRRNLFPDARFLSGAHTQ